MYTTDSSSASPAPSSMHLFGSWDRPEAWSRRTLTAFVYNHFESSVITSRTSTAFVQEKQCTAIDLLTTSPRLVADTRGAAGPHQADRRLAAVPSDLPLASCGHSSSTSTRMKVSFQSFELAVAFAHILRCWGQTFSRMLGRAFDSLSVARTMRAASGSDSLSWIHRLRACESLMPVATCSQLTLLAIQRQTAREDALNLLQRHLSLMTATATLLAQAAAAARRSHKAGQQRYIPAPKAHPLGHGRR